MSKTQPTNRPLEFGVIIKAHREAMKWNIKTACGIAGISYTTWIKLERGDYPSIPSTESINKMCAVLKIKVGSKIYNKLVKLTKVEGVEESLELLKRELDIMKATKKLNQDKKDFYRRMENKWLI